MGSRKPCLLKPAVGAPFLNREGAPESETVEVGSFKVLASKTVRIGPIYTT